MTTSASQRTADGADSTQPDEQESVEAPAIPASAFAEPGVSSPSRDAFDLFRQAPDASRPEPVTQPMAILQTPDQQADAPAPAAGASPQLGLFAPAQPSAVERALEAIDPDALTPREALEALYRLKALG